MKEAIKEFVKARSFLTVRGYQVETINECLTLFTDPKHNYQSLLIESPTGSGKTIMGIITATLLAQKEGYRNVGWVAMRKNLLIQATEVVKKLQIDVRFVPISMFDKNPPKVDMLVIDEAHHDATASMSYLHNFIKPKKILGLSATPIRTDKAELIFEKSIAKAGIYELVRLGFLAKPDQFVIPDWQVETVCKTYLSDPEKWGKSIMFFFRMEECKDAMKILRDKGVSCDIVHATSNREEQFDLFDKGELKVLINMAILTEGFDCPDLETVFVRPSSLALTQQMAGRVLRLFMHLRKKIVQSQDTESPFQRIAPVGRSFRQKADGSWMALDYDEDIISKIITMANSSTSDILNNVSKENHLALKFLNRDKKKSSSSDDEEEMPVFSLEEDEGLI